jgi:hypothetical protein
MSVYFYWSGQEFDYGNLLAVASAALHAPGEVVLIVDERPVGNPNFDCLSAIENVTVKPLVLDDLMPPEHAALYQRMRFPAHRSDLVSFWLLTRHGGIYLDTDTVTRSTLTDIPPRFLLTDGKIVQLGLLALPKGDALGERMLESFLGMPEKDLDVYQSIVYRWTQVVREAGDAVEFGDLDAYFPVHWKQWETIFRPGEFPGDMDAIHILHHYGYFSRAYTARMNARWIAQNDCLFSRVAAPVIDELGRVGVRL